MGDHRFLVPGRPQPTTRDLLLCLKQQVDPEVLEALEAGTGGLVISEGNRKTLLRMMGTEAPEAQLLDQGAALDLVCRLDRYLQCYMADRPEGHIWIIICCLFSAFVLGEPLHPQDAAHWTYTEEEGYRCPAYEPGEDSLCTCCACSPRSPVPTSPAAN